MVKYLRMMAQKKTNVRRNIVNQQSRCCIVVKLKDFIGNIINEMIVSKLFQN